MKIYMMRIYVVSAFLAAALFFFGCSEKSDSSRPEHYAAVDSMPVDAVSKLAANGDRDARFKLALSAPEKESLAEISKLFAEGYSQAGLRLAMRASKTEAEKADMLKRTIALGNPEYSQWAKAELCVMDLNASLNKGDGAAFNTAFRNFKKMSENGFQPAAADLWLFLKARGAEAAKFCDTGKEKLAVLAILARETKSEPETFRALYAEELARNGDWNGALKICGPLSAEFLKRGDFSAGEKLSRAASGRLFSEAKCAALEAYALDKGLGADKNPERAKVLRAKIAQLGNSAFCGVFAAMFGKSFGESIVAESPRDAEFYLGIELKAKAADSEILKNHNAAMSAKISAASEKKIEALEKSEDPIDRAQYAQKLLDLKMFAQGYGAIPATAGIYSELRAPEALAILNKEAANGSAFADLTLAKLYLLGNVDNDNAMRLNMPVDFDLVKARAYAFDALRVSKEPYLSGEALNILGKTELLKDPTRGRFGLDGYSVNPENFGAAMRYFIEAGKFGNADALNMLSSIYDGVSISAEKYLVEPNRKASFGYLKRAADLGDVDAAAAVAYGLYTGTLVDKNIEASKKYLLIALSGKDDSAHWNIAFALSIAAHLAARDELPGYTKADVGKLRARIPQGLYLSVCELYRRGVLKDAAEEKYWEDLSMAASRKRWEPKTEDLKFVKTFEAMPDGPKAYFLRMLAYQHCDLEKALDYAEKLAAGGNAKALSFCLFPYNSSRSEALIERAKKAGVPFHASMNTDNEYFIRRYEQTGRDVFLRYMFPAKNDSPEKYFAATDCLKKYGKNNHYTVNWAMCKIAGNGTKRDIPAAVAALAPYADTKPEAALLLAYANSGLDGCPKNPDAYARYLAQCKKYVRNGEFIPYFYNYFTEPPEGLIMLHAALEKRALNYSDVDAYSKLSDGDLEKIVEANSGNASAKTVLAARKKEKGRFSEAAALFSELLKENPDKSIFALNLAELYYYGEGVEKDCELAKKYYAEFFDELSNNSSLRNETYGVLEAFRCSLRRDGVRTSGINMYAKIPKEIMLSHLKTLPENVLKSAGTDTIRYLERNGEDKLAAKYREKLIAAGDKNTTADLARNLLKKRSPENDKRAFELFEKVCGDGSGSFCRTELGEMYFYGIGTKQNYTKALELFTKGADDEKYPNITDMIWCALMYSEGRGVPASSEKAQMYIDKAKLLAERRSFYHDFWWCGTHMYRGGGVNHYRFPINRKLGVELIKISALAPKPDSSGMRDYAEILEEGIDLLADHAKAAELYEAFARAYAKSFADQRTGGYPDSSSMYWGFGDAIRIYKTSNSARNPEKAASLGGEWLKRFPDSVAANTDTALLYLSGVGVEKNPQKAVELLEKAVSSKNKADMQVNGWRARGVLIDCLMDGRGTAKNPERLAELITAVRRDRASRCGVWHPFLEYAAWFNPNSKITDASIVENPALAPSAEKTLFWMGQFEDVARKASNQSFRIKAYKRLADFYTKQKGFENSAKAEEFKKLIADEETKRAKKTESKK